VSRDKITGDTGLELVKLALEQDVVNTGFEKVRRVNASIVTWGESRDFKVAIGPLLEEKLLVRQH
jgi:hypothetical protein